jgi:hypothetical protein
LELYFALNKSKAQQGRKPETHATLGIKHWGKIYKTKRKTKRLTPTTTKPGNETRVKRKKHNKKKNTHS